jgi:uncharacterized protein (TIGR02118 family)
MYPRAEGARFDHDYYLASHVPLTMQAWGVDRADVDRGIGGPYEAAAHFTFESMDALRVALSAPATAALTTDRPNYTDIEPVVQTSEIVQHS